MKLFAILSILLIFGAIPVYADENLREKLEDGKDILDYTIRALNADSFLIKNYVRENHEPSVKVISNCGKVGTMLYHKTTSIFYGKVIEITDSKNPLEKVVTLEIEKKLYGDIPNPIQIVTDIEECGNAFELDKEFLVSTVGTNPLFAPFYFVTPPRGPIPEGPHSSSYDVENSIGYIERVYSDTGEFDRLNQLKPQIDHAYNVIKSWEKENNAMTSFGMWFVADDTNGLVKLDKGQMALVVSMGVKGNSSIIKDDLAQLLKGMLGDIPIHLVGQTFFVREGTESDESSQIPPPLKQLKAGISPQDIECKKKLRLIFKPVGLSPACVKPQTFEKLIERGWRFPTDSASIIDADFTNIIDANNQFAFDFYYQLTNDNEENVFFSPWSISTAFAIVHEGAKETTAEEIRDVFGFAKDDKERRSAFQTIHDKLNEKDAKYKLHIANALWLAEGFVPLPEYVNTAKTFYDSEVSNVNFITDEGVNTINEWVKSKTEDKIEKLLEPGSTDANTRLAITNAIYFKGTWVTQFDKDNTRQDDFRVSMDKVVQVPMMKLDVTKFNYTSNEQLQILELPYEGDKLSMLVLLPNDVNGLKSLEDALTAENLAQWKSELAEISIAVYMPKFTLKTDYDLIDKLQNLGMHSAFDPGTADFTGITEMERLFIQAAIHKAFVDVNEEGTEAAAATAIIVGREGAPFTFRADHPFIFLIQEKETNQILFFGRVVNPIE